MSIFPNRIRERPEAAPLPRPLQLFLAVAGALTALALSCCWYRGHVLHLGTPYDSIFPHDPRGVDLTVYRDVFRDLHRFEFFARHSQTIFRYPAAVAPIYAALYKLPHDMQVLQSFIVLSFLLCAVLLGRTLMSRGLAAGATVLLLAGAAVTAYPVCFEVRQCNTEIVPFLLVATALWAYRRERSVLSSICLGAAGALKIFPLVYLGLFLARRKYWPILLSAGMAAVTTLFALRFLTPSIAFSWHGVQSGLLDYKMTVVETRLPDSIGFEHSIFTLFKIQPAPGHIYGDLIPLLLRIYMSAAGLAGLVLYVARIRRAPFLNQVLFFTTACVFLPPSSFDYTLISLYVPWALLVLFTIDRGAAAAYVPGLKAAFVCLAILMAPETELIFHKIILGGVVKAATSLALFCVAARYPFAEDEEPAPTASVSVAMR